MLTLGLALASAIGYGLADFFGRARGTSRQRDQSHVAPLFGGLVTVAVILPWEHSGAASLSSAGWGALSGAGLGSRTVSATSGALGACASILYLLALHSGFLAVAAVVTSLCFLS
jgi:hypothetical protein